MCVCVFGVAGGGGGGGEGGRQFSRRKYSALIRLNLTRLTLFFATEYLPSADITTSEMGFLSVG